MIGLDYNAVFQVAKIDGIEITEDLFQKIRLLEAEQLADIREVHHGGRS